uniref:YncE family protein n=1 Tax=Segatella hominis TaxID=2518605 RepID=UPI0040294E7E
MRIKFGNKILGMLAMMGLSLLFVACSNENGEDNRTPEIPKPEIIGENLIICNEGNWQSDNGQLSYYDGTAGVLTNKWFRQVNGSKLGDTPNDIIQVNDTLIAIAVNWSNIIQYIHPDGTACGATENVPNNRRMCADGNYLYITSYAHKCGNQTFEKGYVAKIDVKTKQVVATCEVGWEPEGVRLYEGKLYVANTGGYAFSENHAYETTVQVVDAETMKSVKTIDTGCINLYGEMSQAGQYLCINSCGDYYNVKPKTVIVDCKTDEVKTFDFPCTYNTTDGKLFYTVGSEFSYNTGAYVYQIKTINPETKEVKDGIFCETITQKIKEITSPYELYISPYTKNVYFTDAGSYASAGYLYGYTKEGEELFVKQKVYINPAHILALPIYGENE